MNRKGFTLIEMLVVVGIIATLMGVTIASVSKFTKTADGARYQETVANTATALTALFQREGAWPKAIINNNNKEAGLDAKAAFPLAKGGYMSLTMNDAKTQLAGYDRFGVLNPGGISVIKRLGDRATEDAVRPYILLYAVDLDGDGVISEVMGNAGHPIRATAAVWCAGKDGKIIRSWTAGQARRVEE